MGNKALQIKTKRHNDFIVQMRGVIILILKTTTTATKKYYWRVMITSINKSYRMKFFSHSKP